MDVSDSVLRTQKKVRRTVGKNLYHLREYRNHHKPTVGKTMHIKIALGRGSGGNEKHVIRDWRKGDLCYTAAESLAGLCPAVICKAELVNDKLG